MYKSNDIQQTIKLFRATQCSWCKRFYTQPFLCPFNRLQSTCVSFEALTQEERNKNLNDQRWWWRMGDMLYQVQQKGIFARCRKEDCGALNPNPQQLTCWSCGMPTLCCPDPKCGDGKLYLDYDVNNREWKCINTAHGAKYKFFTKYPDFVKEYKPYQKPITLSLEEQLKLVLGMASQDNLSKLAWEKQINDVRQWLDKRGGASNIGICPMCKKNYMLFNSDSTVGECLNPGCKYVIAPELVNDKGNTEPTINVNNTTNIGTRDNNTPTNDEGLGNLHREGKYREISNVGCLLFCVGILGTVGSLIWGLINYFITIPKHNFLYLLPTIFFVILFIFSFFYNNPYIKRNKKAKEEFVSSSKEAKGRTSLTWLWALLLVFAFTLTGLGISLFTRSVFPLWVLLGFSIIFSIEKWGNYIVRKYKVVRFFYRLLLNLLILALFGILIWSGIKLFSHEFAINALAGSLILVGEFGFFVWLWRVVARNSHSRPSMKLTIFTIIVLFLILAFAGVQPMTGYKDSLINSISSTFSSSQNTNPSESNNLITPIPTSTHISIPTNIKFSQSTLTINPSKTGTTTPKTTGINASTGVYKNYYLGLVDSPEGTLTGTDCYGEFIVLINNKNAQDPTYNQLISFLMQDNTDQFPYTYDGSTAGSYYGTAESHIDLGFIKNIIDGTTQPASPKICADFAERLHNNAEIAGIRCAYVSLDMTGYDDPYNYGIASDAGHACNAFQTTDRGLIYIDCTGGTIGYGPSSNDTTVDIQIGKEYIPQYIFPSGGWTIDSMGTVTDIYMTWDGNWNN